MALEDALQEHEETVDKLLKSANKYVSSLKSWKKACAVGHIGNLNKFASQSQELVKDLPNDTANTKSTWLFDVKSYLESDEWRQELSEIASSKYGLRTIQDDSTLISSPVSVRSQPGRNVLLLGRNGWPAIRPHVVAEELKRLRDKTANANSQEFLESVYNACVYLSKGGKVEAKFRDIYDLFCLTPGYKKDNPPAAFAQQIYALHQAYTRNELLTTRSGKSYSFDYPSGGLKERDIFSVVSEEGKTVRYYIIWFK